MTQENYNNKIVHDLTMYILKSRFNPDRLNVSDVITEYKTIYHEVEQTLSAV